MKWIIGLVAMALMFVAACAAPPGKGRLDLWLVSHVNVGHEDLDGCAEYRASSKTIVLDDACIAPWSPDVREFIYYHEAGHAIDAQLLNFMHGAYGVRTEQFGQCVAEVATGNSPPYSVEQIALGYWDCPDEEVNRTRDLMVAAGVW